MASDNDASVKPLETSFLSEGKLMILGSRFWSRNKMPFFPLPSQTIAVPEGVSTLDEALFRNFVRDVQASIRCAEDSSPSFWFFYGIYLLLIYIIERGPVWYVVIAILLVVFTIWCKTFRDVFEREINSRVQEWQPWFGNVGFSIEYVVDKPRWWMFTETYILMQPVAVQEYKLPATNEGSKYLVYFARSFVARNQGFRVLDVRGAGRAERMVIPKAPALPNLDTRVFSEVMNEAKTESSLYSQKTSLRMIGVFCFTFGLGIIVTPKYAVVIALGTVFLAFATYYNILPASGMYTLPSNKLEEWDGRLQEHGYNLTYHVDKPTWWQWHESYLEIHSAREISGPAAT
jgi:hypothetical protein